MLILPLKGLHNFYSNQQPSLSQIRHNLLGSIGYFILKALSPMNHIKYNNFMIIINTYLDLHVS